MEVFEIVLDQVQKTAHTMQFYFQGEPLLNKQLPEMIARAHHAGLYTIVSTNAQALDKKMADVLVMCMHIAHRSAQHFSGTQNCLFIWIKVIRKKAQEKFCMK